MINKAKKGKKQGYKQVPIQPIGQDNGQGEQEEDIELDIVEQITKQLADAGYETAENKKFILLKKNEEKGLWERMSTTEYALEPDLVGKKFGGGTYEVKVQVDGRFRAGKTFNLSTAVFGEGELPSVPTQAQEQEQELYSEPPTNAFSGGSDIAMIVKAMADQQNQNQKMLIDILRSERKNETDLLLKGYEMANKNANTGIDGSKMVEVVMNAFNQGINMTKATLENQGNESMGDVFKGIIKGVVESLDIKSMLKARPQLPMAQPPAIAQQNVIAENPVATPPQDQVLLAKLVGIFLSQVAVGYENEVDEFYFADNIKRIPDMSPIEQLVLSSTDEVLLASINQTPYKAYLDKAEFKTYLLEVFYCVRNYDQVLAELKAEKEQTQNTTPVGDTSGNEKDKPII